MAPRAPACLLLVLLAVSPAAAMKGRTRNSLPGANGLAPAIARAGEVKGKVQGTKMRPDAMEPDKVPHKNDDTLYREQRVR